MNKAIRFRLYRLMVLAFCSASAVSLAQTPAKPPATAPAKPLAIPPAAIDKEIIRKAGAAYYNLKSHGLVEFQSNVQPNWQLVLKEQIASNPEGAAKALKLLEGIKFTVALDSTGAVKVTHREEVAPTNEKVSEGFTQIFAGMEQAMTGFFDTWSQFMLFPPVPSETDDFKIDDGNGQYKITQKQSGTEIVITMAKDFSISEMKTVSPEFTSSIKPRLRKIPQGLLLVGYDAAYQGIGGKDATVLNVQAEYQDVEGLQLLSKLNLSGSYQAKPEDTKSAFAMEMTFNQYKVKKQ